MELAQEKASRKTRPLAERFWEKVLKAEPQACWPWNGAKTPAGYGNFGASAGKTLKAHRVAYELTHGPIPDGLVVCHRCDNPSCVNPEHLFLGTHTDNMQDCKSKGRHSTTAGEERENSKLTWEIVREIRATPRTTDNGVLATRYGIDRSTISRVRNGQRWKEPAL